MDAGQTTTRPQPRAGRIGRAAHPIMFWVLTGLALLTFAPCVLVPLWYDGEQLRAAYRTYAQAVARLEAQAARNRARMEALRGDPLVVERVMRRELNYQAAHEQVLQLPTALIPATEPPSLAEPPPPPPTELETSLEAIVRSLGHWLPAWPWEELFARSPNRTLLMLAAGGLQAAAFLLYAPSPKRTSGSRTG